MRPIQIWNDDHGGWVGAYALEFTGPHADVSLLYDEAIHPRYAALPLASPVVDETSNNDEDDDDDDALLMGW